MHDAILPLTVVRVVVDEGIDTPALPFALFPRPYIFIAIGIRHLTLPVQFPIFELALVPAPVIAHQHATPLPPSTKHLPCVHAVVGMFRVLLPVGRLDKPVGDPAQDQVGPHGLVLEIHPACRAVDG